jgi:nucleoside-diphosphate-sugar epimerase
MWDANVGLTTRVLDAAQDAGIARLVYVSTLNVFGNTHGQVVDETYRRDLREGFISWYDETKFGAHEVVEQRIRAGAPIVVVMPGQVYGPGDHSEIGEQLALAHAGRLAYRTFDDMGITLVHVDDVAAGIVAALDRGTTGQSYTLAGAPVRFVDAIELAARLGGKHMPALRMPTGLMRLFRPLGRLIGQANLTELITAADGVTYWVTADKAATELSFEARDLEKGLRDTFEAGSLEA